MIGEAKIRQMFNKNMKLSDIQLYDFLMKNKKYIQCGRITLQPQNEDDFNPHTGYIVKPVQNDELI